jgi:hypothetical protein
MAPLQGGIGPNGEDTTMNEKNNIGILFFCFQFCEIKKLVKISIKIIHEVQRNIFLSKKILQNKNLTFLRNWEELLVFIEDTIYWRWFL